MDGRMNMSKYDMMVAFNKKTSANKIELARNTIFKMLDEGEKISIPKLMTKTGLSRGFFYKNLTVRKLLYESMESQVGLVDPRRNILDMAMDNEITMLHAQVKSLRQENERLKAENEKLQKALERKNINLLQSL